MAANKIKKGDKVIVLTGREKGKQGEVIKVDPVRERVLVQGVNMVKRHAKASARGPGGINEIEAPIHVSNVAHLDPKSGKPTREKLIELGLEFASDVLWKSSITPAS